MTAPINTNEILASVSERWYAEKLTSQSGVNLKYRVMRDTCADFHVHEDWSECFFVLTGCVFLDTQEATYILESGPFFEVPAGISHRSRVVGDANVLVLDQGAA